MLKFLRKKANNTAEAVRLIENDALMQATVGLAVLTMWADGTAEDSERDRVAKVLANTPELKGFGPQVQSCFNEFDTMCQEAGFMMAKVQIMRKISAVKGDRAEMENVLVTGLTIALADGELEDAELAVLRPIASAFGLRLEDYL